MAKRAIEQEKGKPSTYRSLMASQGIDELSNELALEKIGYLIDACQPSRRLAGIVKALEWCDALEARGLAPVEQTELDYFRANAWDTRRPRHRSAAWRWEQPALQEEILCLRRARIGEGFDKLPPIRRCQFLTNLGNQLSAAGRMVEALELWSEALAIEPNFWMARGNRGSGFLRYGRSLYSEYHAGALFVEGHKDLVRAIDDAATHGHFGFPEAREHFEREKASIEAHVDIVGFAEQFAPDDGPLGKSQAERHYRHWCLTNRLFLNPINDALLCAAAADDGLELPDFVTKIGDPPTLIGFFNQLKQEYVSARWAYYSGIHSARPHFSDRHVTLLNTLDYPAYGLAVEQLRTSFRVAYSLLDKVAFFINSYFDLGIPSSEVSFGRVWRDKKGKTYVIAPRFDRSKNLPLRGLYWLSKDLLDPSLKSVMDPDAQALSEIRNHLEHRYLKIHEIFLGKTGPQQPRTGDTFVDTMAYSVGRRDFEKKTVRLIKLSRAALIHLALGMNSEEQRRQRARRSKRPLFGQSLPVMEERWKR
jgi:hypothetical protein